MCCCVYTLQLLSVCLAAALQRISWTLISACVTRSRDPSGGSTRSLSRAQGAELVKGSWALCLYKYKYPNTGLGQGG